MTASHISAPWSPGSGPGPEVPGPEVPGPNPKPTEHKYPWNSYGCPNYGPPTITHPHEEQSRQGEMGVPVTLESNAPTGESHEPTGEEVIREAVRLLSAHKSLA